MFCCAAAQAQVLANLNATLTPVPYQPQDQSLQDQRMQDQRQRLQPISNSGSIVLNAGVSVQDAQPLVGLRIIDDVSGQPLSGVRITLPQHQRSTGTNAHGLAQLPQLALNGNTPIVLSMTQPGYWPLSITLHPAQYQQWHQGQAPVLRLKTIKQGVVLDSRWRHLGDNSYAPNSAGASQFKSALSASPKNISAQLSLSFEVPEYRQSAEHHRPPVLTIGTVLGLDTAIAHQLGQSRFHRVSNPGQVLLNGQVIGQLAQNGDRLQFPIPPHVLKPGQLNQLTIVTGWQSPDGQYRDDDDMELMHVMMTW